MNKDFSSEINISSLNYSIYYSMQLNNNELELEEELQRRFRSGVRFPLSSTIAKENKKSKQSQIKQEYSQISNTTTKIDKLTSSVDKLEKEMKYTYNKVRSTPIYLKDERRKLIDKYNKMYKVKKEKETKINELLEELKLAPKQKKRL